MKGRAILISVLALGLMLALAAGFSLAQGPGPQGDGGVQAAPVGTAASAPLSTGFIYQGRLNDGGSAANGTYDFEFKLYNAASSGSQVGSTITRNDVAVTDGLFTVELDFGSGTFTGDARWLEITVRPGASTGAYTTLTPRQALTATPYALYALSADTTYLQRRVSDSCTSGNAIRVINQDGSVTCEPVVGGGAHDHLGETWTGNTPLTISGNFADAAPLVLSNGSGGPASARTLQPDRDGLRIQSAADDGVQVDSAGDDGVFVVSAGEDGVLVESAGRDAFSVVNAGMDGLYVKQAGDDGVDVRTAGDHGVYVESAGDDGVHIQSANGAGFEVVSAGGRGIRVGSTGLEGVLLESTGGNGVYIVSAGNDALSVSSASNDGLHVGSAGRDGVHISAATQNGVYAHTAGTWGFYTPDKIYAGNGYVDIAEHIDVAGDMEAGDVVVIDPDHDERVVKSTKPYDTSVAGIISTDPAMLIGKSDTETPLALAGRVPCKVSAENGPIYRGDLLTTSSTPGHAMKATEPKLGTILGKALGELESGTGVIHILVTLQ
jgi:hypothetical protein